MFATVWVKDYDITVEKIWQNVGNFRDYLPDSVTVELLKNGSSFDTAKTPAVSSITVDYQE